MRKLILFVLLIVSTGAFAEDYRDVIALVEEISAGRAFTLLEGFATALAEGLRETVRWLHATGQITQNLSAAVIALSSSHSSSTVFMIGSPPLLFV